ncbi:MAG: winged helix-turn-helix domain-containing protein [Candidatus Hodarchaeota archaeon]
MTKKLTARFRLWLEMDTQTILGKGGAALLEDIQAIGSIHKATEGKMSYRFAWGRIKKIEERLGKKIVETHRGGVQGGGAHLTKEGIKLLQFYRTLEGVLNEALQEAFSRLSNENEL